MDGRIIFLIIALITLVVISLVHWACTYPTDFEDWFIEEHMWVWWLGAVVFFAVLYGFIFWSWQIMLIIFSIIILFGIIIWMLYHLHETKEKRMENKIKNNEKKYENRVYEFFKKLMIYPSITAKYDKENNKFRKHLKNVRKNINNKLIELEGIKKIPIDQSVISKLDCFNEKYRKHIEENRKLCNQESINFFERQYDQLNALVLDISEEICKALAVKNGKASIQKSNSLIIYDFIPKDMQKIARDNLQPYIELFELENFVRIYINLKYFKEYGNYDLESLFKNCQNAYQRAQQRLKEDEKQGWKKQRGSSIIFYVNFDDLVGLMTNNTNWDLFKDDFHNADFIKLRLRELYQIRNNIAHNVMLGKSELDALHSWSNQIYNQLTKYKDEIKNWQVSRS